MRRASLKVYFILSALGLASAATLYLYLEVSPQSPTPLEELKALIFPDAPTTTLVAVRRTPTFNLSEGNLLLAWGILTGACTGAALIGSLRTMVTPQNSQLRAVTFVCALLAGVCLLVLAPLLASVYTATRM